ncbi:MAG: hypothetical protein ACLQVF_24930, partial [Isosphaeraceae bacterium]
LGRSDATLNRYGVRIGTAEIYAALESVEETVSTVAVAVGSGLTTFASQDPRSPTNLSVGRTTTRRDFSGILRSASLNWK